jgi:MSHA biogenesis protein MshK
MAGFLNLLLALCLLTLSAASRGEPLHDPMRPPPAFLPGSPPPTALSAPAEKPLVLQSVLLSPQRKQALISGQRVALGQSLRGYQLVGLSSTEARLLGENGIVILKLLSARSPDPAASGVAAQHTQGDSK